MMVILSFILGYKLYANAVFVRYLRHLEVTETEITVNHQRSTYEMILPSERNNRPEQQLDIDFLRIPQDPTANEHFEDYIIFCGGIKHAMNIVIFMSILRLFKKCFVFL